MWLIFSFSYGKLQNSKLDGCAGWVSRKFNEGLIKAYKKMRSNRHKSACLLQRVVMPQKVTSIVLKRQKP